MKITDGKKLQQYRGSASLGKCHFRKSKEGSTHPQAKTGATTMSRNSTSSNERIIYQRNTKCTTSRKTILVFKELTKTRSKWRNFVSSKGVSDPIYKSPSSGEPCKPNKNFKPISFDSKPGNMRVVGIATQKLEDRNSSRRISEQSFFVAKKDGENCPVINLKKTKHICSLRRLQSGRFDYQDPYFAIYYPNMLGSSG